MLAPATKLSLSEAAAELFPEVSLDLCSADGMYHGNARHYLEVGASALSVILCALQLARVLEVAHLLDFGSGAGRVTRWLRAAFPTAEITVSDMRATDLEFCVEHFGAKAWLSGTDIEVLEAPGQYDLIWAGSVLTHLSAEKSRALLAKFIGWAKPGGIIIVTLHGRRAIQYRKAGRLPYLHDLGWQKVQSEYNEWGYGYSDYERANGYGISLTSLGWSARLVESMEDVRLVMLSENAWDDHQDVLALQKRTTVAPTD